METGGAEPRLKRQDAMTSAQTMLKGAEVRVGFGAGAREMAAQAIVAVMAMVIAAAFGLGGCASERHKLVAPVSLTAPYQSAAGEVLWGVVPLRNESGTLLVDPYRVTDKVVGAAAQVQGVRTLPLNRTLEAMRALQMDEPRTPADIERLAQVMGVDGLIVGSITAYDPYDPPVLGLSLALHARTGSTGRSGSALNVDALRHRTTEGEPPARSNFQEAPASVVSVHLDGKSHQVQMDAKTYAEGRHDAAGALGWRRYLASMDLYTEFAAWHAVRRLLDQEWMRLARAEAAGE